MAFRFHFFTDPFRIDGNGLYDDFDKAIGPLIDPTQDVVIEKVGLSSNHSNSRLVQSIYEQYLQFRSDTYKFMNR